MMLFQKLIQNKQYKIQPKQRSYFTINNIALDPQSAEAALYLTVDNKNILIAQLSRNSGGIKSIPLNLNFCENQTIILMSKEGSVHVIGSYKQCDERKNSYGSKVKKYRDQQMIEQKQQKQHKNKKQGKYYESPTEKPQILHIQKLQQKQSETLQPLRRSTRIKTITKPIYSSKQKEQRRQRQELRNMANYFAINENDLDDDQNENFEKDNQEDNDNESEDDDEDEEENKSNESESSSQSNRDQQKKEETQIVEKAKLGRKKKVVQKEQKDKIDDIVGTQYSKLEESSKQQQLSSNLHFSVPTRNPYS